MNKFLSLLLGLALVVGLSTGVCSPEASAQRNVNKSSGKKVRHNKKRIRANKRRNPRSLQKRRANRLNKRNSAGLKNKRTNKVKGFTMGDTRGASGFTSAGTSDRTGLKSRKKKGINADGGILGERGFKGSDEELQVRTKKKKVNLKGAKKPTPKGGVVFEVETTLKKK